MIARFNVNYETSWRAIAHDLRHGNENPALKSGSVLYDQLSNGWTVGFQVCRDANRKVFFIAKELLPSEHQMNDRDTNEGGWRDSEMRRYLNEDIFPMLSDDLRSVITPTRIVQVLDGTRIETEDMLFIPSRTQLFGRGDYSEAEPDDTVLDVFSCRMDSVKSRNGSPAWYWLRSPHLGGTTNFMSVNSIGSLYYHYGASHVNGVCPGFSIEQGEELFV